MRFLTFTCQLYSGSMTEDDSKLENFYHQIIENLLWNATEIVIFLKYVQNLGFLKIGKGGKFTVECVSNDILS